MGLATLALSFCLLGAATAQWPDWPPNWDQWNPQPNPNPNPVPSNQDCSCGIENTGGRIIGGSETVPHRYPWMVALVQPNQPTRQFCGGTLISDRHVLTAAHCFDQTSEYGVHVAVGAHRLTQVSPQSTIPVQRIIRHQQWSPQNMKNDITILVLARPVTFSDKVRPACLPTASMTRNSNYFVTGWGTMHPTQVVPPDPLMEVAAPEIDAGTCSRNWPVGNGATQICAGQRGHSSCRGDSGGPLQSRVNGKVYHTGIVSFGPQTCANGDPAVYTRVSAYRDWIDANTRGAKFCSS